MGVNTFRYDVSPVHGFINAFNAIFRREKNVSLAMAFVSQIMPVADIVATLMYEYIMQSNCAGKRLLICEYIKKKYELTSCAIQDSQVLYTRAVYGETDFVPFVDVISVYGESDTVSTNEGIRCYGEDGVAGVEQPYTVFVNTSDFVSMAEQVQKFYCDNIENDVRRLMYPNSDVCVEYLS